MTSFIVSDPANHHSSSFILANASKWTQLGYSYEIYFGFNSVCIRFIQVSWNSVYVIFLKFAGVGRIKTNHTVSLQSTLCFIPHKNDCFICFSMKMGQEQENIEIEFSIILVPCKVFSISAQSLRICKSELAKLMWFFVLLFATCANNAAPGLMCWTLNCLYSLPRKICYCNTFHSQGTQLIVFLTQWSHVIC